MASVSPVATLSVAATSIVTVPSHGAENGVSIFMTSMTSSSSPFATRDPFAAVMRSTVPGTGAITFSPPPVATAPTEPPAVNGHFSLLPSFCLFSRA